MILKDTNSLKKNIVFLVETNIKGNDLTEIPDKSYKEEKKVKVPKGSCFVIGYPESHDYAYY